MDAVFTEAAVSATARGFSEEQKLYLRGFFEGALQRMPFAGHTAAGTLTHDPASGTMNLAAPEIEREPLVWGTPVSELCAEEVWKFERNPLDCWDDLIRHAATNQAPDAEFRYRFKSYGLFYVTPAQDSFMLRLRVPGGVLESRQLRGLIAMAERWGCPRLDLTTRANVQIRELQPRSVVDVLNTVQRLGMSSRGSGADNLRNLTASPLSGLDSAELIDVQPYADALQNYITNSRDLFGLPRKFNIAMDGGGTISTLADTNDLGFVAVHVTADRTVPPGIYFRVLLSGITGHRQFASDSGLLLLPEQLVAVAAAIVRVFAEHGNRTDRKKARMKYLLDRWGLASFLQAVQEKLDFPLMSLDAAECEPRGPVDRAAHLGAHPQRQPGFQYLGVTIPVGWLPVDQARAIADIADRFGSGEVRLTVWQNLLIPNIPDGRMLEAQRALRDAGLDSTAGTVLSGTVACTGSRGCRFAATDTKGHALEIARSLDHLFQIAEPGGQPINLHVTGCNNSCAQHYIGDIGLMGIKVNGAEGYQVNLGGGADADQGLARELFPAMPYADVLAALQSLFAAYESERAESESFLTYTRRHSVASLRALCQGKVVAA